MALVIFRIEDARLSSKRFAPTLVLLNTDEIRKDSEKI